MGTGRATFAGSSPFGPKTREITLPECGLTLSAPKSWPVIIHRYPSDLKAFYFKRDPNDPKVALGMDILAPEGYGEIVGGGQREEDVKELISGVPGFVSYTAFRSGEGGLTVTVCQDKTGTDESSRRAAEWVKENIGATANPPVITEGSTVVHFNS